MHPVQQRGAQLRQCGRVDHTQRHRGAVEVGSEADVIDAGGLHGVVDMRDDLFPRHLREIAFHHHLVIDPFTLDGRAGLVATALLRHRIYCPEHVAVLLFAGDPELFAEECPAGLLLVGLSPLR